MQTTMRELLEKGYAPNTVHDVYTLGNGTLEVKGRAALHDGTVYCLHKATPQERAAMMRVFNKSITPEQVANKNNALYAGKYDTPSHDDGMMQGLIGMIFGSMLRDPNH